jgi:methyl-accepting chemotaxis protein
VEKLIDSIGKINLSINHIMSSNNEIVDSIHQIAATDEQISANAVEAASLSQENLSRTMMVSNLIKDLVNTAKGLEKFQ